MSIKLIDVKSKAEFNKHALHPLQSWEWGEFRKKTGIEVIRLGNFSKDKLIETSQLTIHHLPFSLKTIGYLPKGGIPSLEMLEALYDIGKKNNCIFIKFEPNILKDDFKMPVSDKKLQLINSSHPLFTKFTFQIDLTKSEDELLAKMHTKTRYNIKIAKKNRVEIIEDNSNDAFDKYLELTFETTKRQKFLAHNKQYHQLMWNTLYPSKIAHLLVANYFDNIRKYILVTWIVFLFNDVLYYPYGASSSDFKNIMASNLMMWETIRFGKKNKAKIFDMWGALGPNAHPKDPWYGFHRFKHGYGGKLVEFVGSLDLVIDPYSYKIYNYLHKFRQFYLNLINYF